MFNFEKEVFEEKNYRAPIVVVHRLITEDVIRTSTQKSKKGWVDGGEDFSSNSNDGFFGDSMQGN